MNQNETMRPRPRAQRRTPQDRPLNGQALGNLLALPTIPQRTADHPKQPVGRGKQESPADPEEEDARVDDEPLHREVEDAGTGLTATREPTLGAHTARVIERVEERNTVTKTHFQSNLSDWVGRYVVVMPHCLR